MEYLGRFYEYKEKNWRSLILLFRYAFTPILLGF